MAKANPFRFSTKYQDDETDLLFYGYRSYNPSTGRWISRDPIGRMGGKSSYAILNNDGVNSIDSLGLHQFRLEKPPGVPKPAIPWPGVPGEWMTGGTDLQLSDIATVQKVHGKWLVRAGFTSYITYWYGSPEDEVHELHHVADDEGVWTEFVSEADPYVDKPFCSKKKADCFRQVVESLGVLYRGRAQQIGAQFDCDAYDRAKGGKLGRCSLAATLKPQNDTLAISIGSKILDCEAMK